MDDREQLIRDLRTQPVSESEAHDVYTLMHRAADFLAAMPGPVGEVTDEMVEVIVRGRAEMKTSREIAIELVAMQQASVPVQECKNDYRITDDKTSPPDHGDGSEPPLLSEGLYRAGGGHAPASAARSGSEPHTPEDYCGIEQVDEKDFTPDNGGDVSVSALLSNAAAVANILFAHRVEGLSSEEATQQIAALAAIKQEQGK